MLCGFDFLWSHIFTLICCEKYKRKLIIVGLSCCFWFGSVSPINFQFLLIFQHTDLFHSWLIQWKCASHYPSRAITSVIQFFCVWIHLFFQHFHHDCKYSVKLAFSLSLLVQWVCSWMALSTLFCQISFNSVSLLCKLWKLSCLFQSMFPSPLTVHKDICNI